MLRSASRSSATSACGCSTASSGEADRADIDAPCPAPTRAMSNWPRPSDRRRGRLEGRAEAAGAAAALAGALVARRPVERDRRPGLRRRRTTKKTRRKTHERVKARSKRSASSLVRRRALAWSATTGRDEDAAVLLLRVLPAEHGRNHGSRPGRTAPAVLRTQFLRTFGRCRCGHLRRPPLAPGSRNRWDEIVDFAHLDEVEDLGFPAESVEYTRRPGPSDCPCPP